MDSREVLVIGTIDSLPYKSAVYLDVNITMNILVVDIPSRYGCCCLESGVQLWGVAYSVICLLLLSMLITRL